MKKQTAGFTLIEAILALALFMILSAGVIALWQHTFSAGSAVLARQSTFENARAAMDGLIVNIQMARNITLELEPGNMMFRLIPEQFNPRARPHPYEFRFDSRLPRGHVRHGRLEFGRNEFASYIAEIRLIYIENSRIDIRVATTCENPIVLYGSACVRHKNVEVVAR